MYISINHNKRFQVFICIIIFLAITTTEAELFNIEQFPLLNIEAGINTLGTIEIQQELLPLMLNEELPSDLKAINKAHDQHNWKFIEEITNKMKNGALYRCMTRMKYVCQYLERYQKTGLSHLQNKLYHQLMAVVKQTQHTISNWLDSLSQIARTHKQSH